MNKGIVISLVITVLAIGGIVTIFRSGRVNVLTSSPAVPSNASIVEGKQIIEITAKGG